MELDVLAVGILGSFVGFAAIMWLGARWQRQRDGGHEATDRTVSDNAKDRTARDHGALFDWVMERDDWVVLDLETNGFKDHCEIIEVAVIDAHGRTLMDQLVMPKGRIPKDATKVHGIDRKMLKDKPTWPEVADSLSALLQGRRVVTYNAEFDLRLLSQTFAKWGMKPPVINGHCAMLAYAANRAEPHKWRDGEYRWHKLSMACRHENVTGSQDHRALGDARMTRDLIMTVAGKRIAIAA